MPKAIKINHVTVLVSDKNKAKEFYCETLGLEKQEVGNSLWIRIGNQFIHVTENSGSNVPNTFYHFAIEVENVKDYVNELKNKGVWVFSFDENKNEIEIENKSEKQQYFLRDLDGNLIELVDTENKFFNPSVK